MDLIYILKILIISIVVFIWVAQTAYILLFNVRGSYVVRDYLSSVAFYILTIYWM